MENIIKKFGISEIVWWKDFEMWFIQDPITHTSIAAKTPEELETKITASRLQFGVA